MTTFDITLSHLNDQYVCCRRVLFEVEAEEADLANGRYPMRGVFFSDQGSPTWFGPPTVNGRRRLRRFSIRKSAP